MAEKDTKIPVPIEDSKDTTDIPIQIWKYQTGEIDSAYDAVFGKVNENGPNYRSVGWWGTVALMLKTQIGLGVLSIPATFDVLGLVPGIILLCIAAGIATWTSYMVGVFKLNHREVYGMNDAGGLMFGKVGRELFGLAFCLCNTKDWIFVAGSGILGISISLNAVSGHGTCTAAFAVVAATIGFLFASIQTLSRISWIAWFLLSAPHGWTSDFKIVQRPSFADGVSAVSTLIFACTATPAYFSIAAEMRDLRYFNRAVFLSQLCSTVLYVTVGATVYYYCGTMVASPALGSAGPLIKSVSYGIALPGLIASTTILIHIPSKYLFVRILRGSQHLTSNTFIHWSTWIGCTFGCTIIAYVIASGIPVFNNLLSLIGALLGAILAYQAAGCMWFYDNWSDIHTTKRTWRWIALAFWSGFLIVVGTFITIAGTYGSVVNIVDSLQKEGSSRSWTCVDNSNS
ncbi:hypothetical protein N7474_002463 [Penicillium riverlandense]|uniref:uncharacterized protein n=1 Tax=Penicillium riverlandense TaxID=1903569 RepID=UPI0025480A98|nr:uncharacterized protein N7474_002463 [Penicillium riverlandense]KAJ5825325.1 hypothetical protein N7474_002463 [Penicillium riverlandense]